MAKNKVVEVFKSLSKKEIKLLDKFVRSPIFNQHQDVINLFDYLKTSVTNGKNSLESEKIFEKLFPGEPFEVQKLHYINSYLLRVIESFLAWKEWNKEEESVNLYLLRAYRKKRLDDQFEGVFKSLQKLQNKKSFRNNQFHNTEYQMYIEQVKYESNRRLSQLHLQELSDFQDISFIVEKLYNACTIVTHQAVVKKEYNTGLLDSVLKFVENSNLLEIPAVAIYYYSYRALSDVNREEDFQKMKNLLHIHQEKFSISELRDLYLIAVNFCIRQINRNENHYMREVFDLYKSGLKKGVYFENGRMSRWTYRNIVVAGLRMKEFNWVKKFINEFVEMLPENHREGSLNLNLAYYYFEKRDYTKAMPLLQRTEHDDILHNLFGKSMLAKMYYELSEYDSLFNLLQSLRTYIRRKKGLGYHRNNYQTFARYLQKLISLNIYDKDAIRDFQKKIEGEQFIAEREWLLEQVSMLHSARS